MTMRGTLMAVAVLAAVSAQGGCGTAGNLTEKGGCRVYGGTRMDGAIISDSFAPDSEMAKAEGLERPVVVWAGWCGLVDLPFSVVADTVTLPFTVPLSMKRSGAESRAAEQGPPEE